MSTSSNAVLPTADDEFLPPAQFCQKYRFSHSTLSVRIRKGEIALHQFLGEARPKVNVAEALQVMSTVRRPYTAPAVRVVRHGEGSTAPQPRKVNLFA